ncbi:MAG TPA: disulfide bond formation protein B [Steroidobacteraceae bacterium]|nr:disulfide bond formation protein B [Steroidobacteraceae bacterium]
MLQHRRLLNALGAAACAAMLGYAYFAQYVQHYEPCPLCMFQRATILALGIVFIVAAAHSPRGWGRFVYAALIAIAALATIGIAARHLYIQSLPPGSVPSCGAPLDVLVRMFPITTVIAKVLRGGGECAQVNWTFLGLAMPAWVLICAAVLGAYGVMTNVLRGVSGREPTAFVGAAEGKH